MRIGIAASACALVALTLLGTSVATAGPKPRKKKPVVAKKLQLCQLGQPTVGKGAVKCSANPLFAKTICDDYLPQARAFAPAGATVATGGNRYGPFFNEASCYYTVNGKSQSFYFRVFGGKNFHTNSLADPKKQIDLQAAFEEEYQQWTGFENDCTPPVPGTVKTTVEGFEAFTVDLCPPMLNGVVQPTGGQLEILAGYRWILVGSSGALGNHTSADFIPFAEQLIEKYH